VLEPLGLAIDIARKSIDSVGEGERVVRAGDRVTALEKIRKVDVAVAELVHDIRRVAIAVVRIEYQGIAEREGTARLRELMRLERDGTVELARLGKIGEVEPLQRREALRDILLSGCDARQSLILPLMVERRELALGDAEDRCILRIFGEDLVGDGLQLPC